MSSHHSVPISIVAANKSLWCISLSDINTRLSFYPILQSDFAQKISLDIHNEEPLAIIGFDSQIKLFDLQTGRCNILSTNYEHLPARVHLIRAEKCPINEFLVALNNFQISIFDRRQKNGAVQHFYGHHSPITTLQIDTWKLASTDEHGFVRLW
jgi:WD40 repeat protein